MPIASLLLLAAVARPAVAALPPETPVHLGFSLRIADPAAVDALRRAQQDPASADYRRWITPEEFGERFGQPENLCARTGRWLAAAGLAPVVSPNRIFIEARGTAAQVSALLGVHLQRVEGKPPSVHVPDRAPRLPAWLADRVIFVSGLDSRVRYHRAISTVTGQPAFGPQDVRRFYGVAPLLDAGYVGQGQQLVVLGQAMAPGDGVNAGDVDYFFQNVSDSSAAFSVQTLPNPQSDFAEANDSFLEFELDPEMQSVGAPGADSITLVLPPASELFTTGVNYIVSQLPQATAVSTSVGTCEPGIEAADGGLSEADATRQLIVQGTMEGQTWSAAAGDFGAQDCLFSFTGTAAVDFPASIPEMVAVGGTQVNAPAWDADEALTAYQQEVVWNEVTDAGAAATGGGISSLFGEPSYQQGFGFSGRSLPDIALIAGPPNIAMDALAAGQLVPVDGTSVASPLSAGFFALLASRLGTRLGDVHATLYALGAAQQDGGAAVFHDITSGNNDFDGITGFSAGPGFDSVSGWGSLNVAALAAAWPPGADGGTPVAAYSQCGILACDGGPASCTTLPEGPSSCLGLCTPQTAGSCSTGTICSSQSPFAPDGGGACVNGCATDADCASQAGTACDGCGSCDPVGSANTQMGGLCGNDGAILDCPTGAYCETGLLAELAELTALGSELDGGLGEIPDAGGFCTAICKSGGCCPAGAVCFPTGSIPLCLAPCGAGAPCSRPGFVCQPAGDGGVCLPACQSIVIGGVPVADTCSALGFGQAACDVATGICGGTGSPDAGGDAGPAASDGGAPATDAGAAGSDAGAPRDAGAVTAPADAGSGSAISVADAGGTSGSSSGCGCSAASGSVDVFPLGLALALALRLRRRRR